MQILSKQKNSEMCMICGMNNNYGVKAQFYIVNLKLEDNLNKF